MQKEQGGLLRVALSFACGQSDNLAVWNKRRGLMMEPEPLLDDLREIIRLIEREEGADAKQKFR